MEDFLCLLISVCRGGNGSGLQSDDRQSIVMCDDNSTAMVVSIGSIAEAKLNYPRFLKFDKDRKRQQPSMRDIRFEHTI